MNSKMKWLIIGIVIAVVLVGFLIYSMGGDGGGSDNNSNSGSNNEGGDTAEVDSNAVNLDGSDSVLNEIDSTLDSID